MIPFIIAEFASCHGGSLERMLEGVEVARRAGANAFKTWWTSSAERVCQRMSAPENLAIYRLGQFPRESLAVIADAVHAAGLEFLCTVDLQDDIAVVAPYVDRFKVASWGARDKAFIDAHRSYGKPIIVSTGLDGPGWYGVDSLHCVSAYPTPIEEANLAVLWMRDDDGGLPYYAGFSDHTAHILMGAYAVAAGAKILEVHFRLAATPPDNPDYPVSLAPAVLTRYIILAREATKALGDGVKRVMPSEEKNVRFRYV